jgi:putative peptidoglycan lipid II flippase
MRGEPLDSSCNRRQNHSLGRLGTEVKAGDESGRGFVRAAGLVSALTLLSRTLGLAREQAFAALLGAGPHADAFQAAFKVPNLLRDLFAEGALSAAFVPTYTRVREAAGREAAHRLVSRLLTLLAVVLGALVLLGLLGAEWIVRAIAPGFESSPGKHETTVLLTKIMLPFLPIVSFAAVAMGMLNSEGRFSRPALAPSMFNVVSILWAVGLWQAGFGPREVAVGWSIGTLAAGAAQFLVQAPGLRQCGWRFRAEWAPLDPELKRIFTLMAPATAGLAAVQVNIFVNTIFASYEEGAVACLGYAFRILYLPIGIFGVALGTIATTGLARRAAAGDLEGLRVTLRQSVRMLAFLTIPSTAGLIALRVPIVRLIFERGPFRPEDTEKTAAALALYSLGLVAYTGVKVLAPGFYALGMARVPLAASVSAVATNLVVNGLLYGSLGFRAVALGTSLGSIVNVSVLAATFERRFGGLLGRDMLAGILRMASAAAVMVPAVLLAESLAVARFGTAGLLAQAATGLAPIATGIGAYVAGSLILGIPEASLILSAARGRRQR